MELIFSLNSAVLLSTGKSIDSKLKLTMTNGSAMIIGIGFIGSKDGKQVLLEILTSEEYYKLRNWLAVCRILGIKLDGEIGKAYIERALKAKKLPLDTLHKLGSCDVNLRCSKPSPRKS